MLIEFGNDHTTVVGLSQEGKTTAVLKSLLAVPQGALFINTKRDMKTDFRGYTMVDNTITREQLIRLLQKGRKVCFTPSGNKAARSRELAYIIRCIYDAGDMDIFVAVDEVHLYDKGAVEAMDELATTGLSLGYKGIWISQRPANISNTQMSQCRNFVFFWTNMEKEYLKRYGIPALEIEQKLKEGGKYHYVVYDFKEIKGAFKV